MNRIQFYNVCLLSGTFQVTFTFNRHRHIYGVVNQFQKQHFIVYTAPMPKAKFHSRNIENAQFVFIHMWKWVEWESLPEGCNNKSNKATNRVAISWIICHLNGKSCLCCLLLLPLLLDFFPPKFLSSLFSMFANRRFFMAEVISSAIHNRVSIWEEKERNRRTVTLLICMYINVQ